MSMTITQITDAFLDKVKTIFPELEVDHFPGRPEDYRFTHPKGAIQLLYRDRRFERPQATDGTIQVNEPVLTLSFYTRNLRRVGRDEGMYDILETARTEIAKDNSIGHGNTWCRREYLTQQRSGVWIFGQDWVLEDIFIPETE